MGLLQCIFYGWIRQYQLEICKYQLEICKYQLEICKYEDGFNTDGDGFNNSGVDEGVTGMHLRLYDTGHRPGQGPRTLNSTCNTLTEKALVLSYIDYAYTLCK